MQHPFPDHQCTSTEIYYHSRHAERSAATFPHQNLCVHRACHLAGFGLMRKMFIHAIWPQRWRLSHHRHRPALYPWPVIHNEPVHCHDERRSAYYRDTKLSPRIMLPRQNQRSRRSPCQAAAAPNTARLWQPDDKSPQTLKPMVQSLARIHTASFNSLLGKTAYYATHILRGYRWQ